MESCLSRLLALDKSRAGTFIAQADHITGAIVVMVGDRHTRRVPLYTHPGSLIISLVHCETIPRSQKRVSSRTKFGALQSARLEIKGRLRLAGWKKSDYSTDSDCDQALRKHGEGKGEDLVLTFGHDTLKDDFTKAGIEFIPVFVLVIFKGNKLRGLILRSHGSQTFRCVGSFDVYADTLSEKELAWFIAADLESITIV